MGWSPEVAHFWANQSQEEGHAKSMLFEGKSIYSYGHHYEAGRLITGDHGDTVALYNNKAYSVTTTGHMSMIRSASSQFPGFSVRDFDNHTDSMSAFLFDTRHMKEAIFRAHKDHFYNLENYKTAARETLQYLYHFGKSIKLKGKDHKEARTFLKELQKYDILNLFQETPWEDHRKAIDNPIFPLSKEEIEKYKAKVARAEYLERTKLEREPELERARQRRRELTEKKARESMEKDIKQWRTGERYSLWNYPGVLLRLNKDRDRVQTSKGAEISVKVALKLWDRLKARESVTGFDFGPYQADSYENEVLTVGCHRIPIKEIKGIAISLGV